MYRENYINSLRTELLEMVGDYLTPVAIHYGYSEVPLETNIKWRPLVLVIGNYSSGKSTLINEFLGSEVQDTGQAPTDDSFTIITHGNPVSPTEEIVVTEERDGKFLLNDPEYPFKTLKKHGQRFAAHFRLKKVNAPFLTNLAIIDTPGMLDSITERNRGYDYQEVIGDLAQLADLVLVLFDPHKAGTVRETYTSLRETLPARTFEDRVIFVLNRIDECGSMIDLLRVYGTLCWNLSQITGRKDIPLIRLTYSPKAHSLRKNDLQGDQTYLKYLENQLGDLREAILQAPRHRLDHLATFVETHSERLAHFLEAMLAYRRGRRVRRLKYFVFGLLLSIVGGIGAGQAALRLSIVTPDERGALYTVIASGTSLFLVLWLLFMRVYTIPRYHRQRLNNIDQLTPLENQTRRDSWQSIRDLTLSYLKKSAGRFSLKRVRQEFFAIRRVHEKGAMEIRNALNELATLPQDVELTGEEPALTPSMLKLNEPAH